MRKLWQGAALVAAMGLVSGSVAHAEKARKPKPPLEAGQYAFHQTNQQVTIAAEPGDAPAARPDTRLDYFHHGFMPMRVIVTNNSNRTVLLDDARILFITADNRVIQAATDDELQRRLFELKSVRGTKIPLPAPLPGITIHHPPVSKKIMQDDDDFGFKTTTVAPHKTVAGYLYYDMQDVDDPVLKGAVLELRKVKFADGTTLDSFEIALQPAAGAEKSP